jgi:superfamily II DNA or RNA helicase
MLLMHREFLIEQTIKTLVKAGVPRECIGVIKAGYPENRDRPLQLAGIQSLARREHPDHIDVVIVDECHTCCWYTEYARICESFPDAEKIGFSASPWRLKPSKEYFGQWFDHIVKGPSIKELMNREYLSRVRYLGYGGLVDFAAIDLDSSGDFKTGPMEREMIEAGVCEKVRDEILNHCDGRTGVIFNSGVGQSKLQTELLNRAGILTKHIDADTPINERRLMFEELAVGQIQCISSVGCLTEGFDVPSIGYIVLGRATKSKALYFQVAGRGLRTAAGKENCLLLDFGGNVARFGYLTKNQPIQLEPAPPPDEEGMTKTCPSEDGGCGAEVWKFERICPECGYEFPQGEKPDPENFEGEFGELFDEETLEMVRYSRSQRKRRFTRNEPPDALWRTFKNKYDEQVLFAEWLYGATFSGNDSPFNRQQFITYLDKHAPTQDRTSEAYKIWMRHHLTLEFGKPGHKHKVGKNKFSQSQLNLQWWEVLQIDKDADWESIKANYTELMRLYHPESTDLTDKAAATHARQLEWAYELAKLHHDGQSELLFQVEQAELAPDSKREIMLDSQGNPYKVREICSDGITISRNGQKQDISFEDVPKKYRWPTAEDAFELLKKCRTPEHRKWFKERLQPQTFQTAMSIFDAVKV